MKNSRKIFCLLFAELFCSFNVNSSNTGGINIEESQVIMVVEHAMNYIKKYGTEKAIIEFNKNYNNIFMGNYNGMFFVSPLHPDLTKGIHFNYKDASGAFVVQEEIEKAKKGGGWLKGRWRKNPETGKYQCRKIYIHPLPGNYFIGSWYHYISDKPGVCLK
jgi:signal transduction histidine kinase